MTGNHHNTPDPHRAKPRPDPTIGQRYNGTGDKPQVNRFDRIERDLRWLTWLVAINIVVSAAVLVTLLVVRVTNAAQQ